MYFNEKGNTNIDEQLKTKKDYKKILIIGGIILAIAIIVVIVLLIIKNINNYTLTINGDAEITIYQGSIYNELGYNAHDSRDKNLNDKVTVKSNLNTNEIGRYTITYELNGKSKTRTINVIEKGNAITIIHLSGNETIYLSIDTNYDEPGYSAVDTIDGNLTNQVNINSNLDISKKGTYSIIYSVTNSNGITFSEKRNIIVQ